MPHVSFELNGQENLFDLEIERFMHDWEGMVEKIKTFLNSFGPQRNEAREMFLKTLMGYPSIELFLKKYYRKDFNDLAKII